MHILMIPKDRDGLTQLLSSAWHRVFDFSPGQYPNRKIVYLRLVVVVMMIMSMTLNVVLPVRRLTLIIIMVVMIILWDMINFYVDQHRIVNFH